jgi:hypothetical protein
MSDAPERIFASPDTSCASNEWKSAMWHGHQHMQRPDLRTEYIRADLHRAEVEAAVKRAIEACADEIDCGGCYGQCQDPANCHAKEASAIRALASDRASLERIINGGADE